jgi:hypothetical protein
VKIYISIEACISPPCIVEVLLWMNKIAFDSYEEITLVIVTVMDEEN